jgi:hypothetical protein
LQVDFFLLKKPSKKKNSFDFLAKKNKKKEGKKIEK